MTKSQGPTAQDPERNCKSDVPGPSCWLPHLGELENPLRGVKSRRLEWGSRKKSARTNSVQAPEKPRNGGIPSLPRHWVRWTIHHCFLRSHFKTQHEDWEYNPFVRELTYYAQNPELNPQHRRNWAWWPIPVIPGLRM